MSAPLLAERGHAAEHHVVYAPGVEAIARAQRVEHVLQQVDGRDAGEPAVFLAFAAWRANRVVHVGFLAACTLRAASVIWFTR
jgi:hypothetical protein